MAESTGHGGSPPSNGGRQRYRPYSPQKFRDRAHESAHEIEADHDAHPQVDHPLVNHGKPDFIDTPEQLDDLIAHLRTIGRFAYDTEFIGELTYIPKLCLIQVASTDRVALIDPLVGLDLNPFWELLADPAIEKIVHAGAQDIEPVARHLNKPCANIFDTQICAGFAGLAYPVSLSKLVLHLVGAKLGKGLTFTHWDQRPLSSMQLKYAADDVRYLVAVQDEIAGQLDELGHTEWAKAECAAICDPSNYIFDADTDYLRIRGGGALAGKNQAVLRELARWRDRLAQELDVPPRSFLKDEILLDMARTPVKSIEKLDRVRGLPRPVEQDHGEEIVAITAKALATPAGELPETKDYEPTPQQRFRADALFAAFQCICSGRSIDPSLLASRQEIGELFRCITTGESPDKIRLLNGWRKEAAGDAVLALMDGKLELNLAWAQTLMAKILRG
jgi:ribonuclease D